MRITLLLLFVLTFQLQAEHIYSQDAKISLDMKNATIEKVLQTIEEKSDYYFLYNSKLIDVDRKVSVRVKNAAISAVLEKLFKSENVEFEVKGSQIILSPKEMYSQITAVAEAVQQQKKTITGTVVDAAGEPIIGANIIEVGTTNGTVTDMDGKFSLSVEDNATIHISYIGYLEQDIKTAGRASFNITLLEDTQALEEVVVVGYGTQKKGMITGSISSVQSEKLTVAPIANATNTLAGRLPGLVSKQNSGLPGSDAATLSIRGFGSALVIVDGIEGSLSNLDPNQIESVSILKDGAASIYGARAGNGVILITTKRGTVQKPTITLNSSMTWQGPTNMLKPTSSGRWAEMEREAHLNAGNSEDTAPWTAEQVQKFYDGSDPYNFPNTDWYSEIIRDWAPQQQHNVSVRGGSDKIKYYGFFSYLDQETMIKKHGGNFERYNLQSNLDAEITDNLTLQLNLSAVVQDNLTNFRSGDFAVDGWIWQDYWSTLPRYPAHLPDPTKIPYADGAGAGGLHVTSNIDLSGYRKSVTQDVNGQVGLNYKIKWVEGLSARAFVSYFKRYNKQKLWQKPVTLYLYDWESDTYRVGGTNGITKAQLEHWDNDNSTLTQQYSLNFDRAFGDHHVTAMALFESNDYASENLYAQRKDYLTTAIDQLFAGSEEGMRNSGSASEMGRSSYVGRLNYSYKDKYLFESILRADASAKFPEEKRWGYFPSVSLGWVISEEGFMNGAGWLDNLKLRASYGESGYDNVANFAYLAGYRFDQLYIIDSATKQGLISTGLANPNLTWENMKIYNAGIEYSIFNHKLYGEAEVFYRERTGMPATRLASLPSTFGSALPPENLNSQNNRGFEFSAGTRGKLEDLSYDLSGNISWSRSKWDYKEEPEFEDPDQARIEKQSGNWTDRSFGYLTNGLFTSQEQIDNLGYDMDQLGNITLSPGDLWLLDTNDDKVVDWRDKVEIGKGTTPHWMVGFDIVLQYKQFDFAALFQGAFGYHNNIVLANMSDVKYEKRWTPENNDPHALVPRLGGAPTNYSFSDYFYRKAGYLRLKTASLGYNLPKRWLDKMGFSQVRIYAAGVNLLTFSKLSKFGIDPESPSQGGRVGWYYPQQQTISCGVNVSF